MAQTPRSSPLGVGNVTNDDVGGSSSGAVCERAAAPPIATSSPLVTARSSSEGAGATTGGTALGVLLPPVATMHSEYDLRSLSDLRAGDHLCCLYSSDEEHFVNLRRFLRASAPNEKLLYLADLTTEQTLQALFDVSDDSLPGNVQLVSLHSEHLPHQQQQQSAATRLRDTIALVRALVLEALSDGYECVRVTCEMSWTLKFPDDVSLAVELDCGLQRLCHELPILVLCQFDRRRFSSSKLLNVIQLHPLALVDQELHSNFYCMQPDKFSSKSRDDVTLNSWLRNLSERKQVESRLRHALQELEHRVQELQGEIQQRIQTEAALQLMRDKAEATAAAKAAFLASMSHEIRTPMNGVLGMLSVLESAGITSQQRADLMRVMKASGEHLIAIVNDILDFSKLESSKLHLEVLPLRLRRCVRDTVDSFRSTALERCISLQLHIGADVPSAVMADGTRLRQVLSNLLSNALKFTPSNAGGQVQVVVETVDCAGGGGGGGGGSGEISDDSTITTAAATAITVLPTRNLLPSPDATIRFSVKDSGIGVPQRHHRAIFESFVQVDASITRIYGGTGLGLAICKRLVELMRGEISIESAVGCGSRFSVTLPLQRVPLPPSSASSLSPSPSSSSPLAAGSDSPPLLPIPTLPPPTLSASATASTAATAAAAAAVAVAFATTPSAETSSPSSSSSAAASPATSPPSLFTPPVLLQPVVDLGKIRILVAEDNAVNRQVLAMLLNRLNAAANAVSMADNGDVAVRLAAEARQAERGFDLILMDIQMPVMDGIEASRRILLDYDCSAASAATITTTSHRRRPIIIAVTASVDPFLQQHGYFDAILIKPITLGSLRDCLENLVGYLRS